MQRFIFPGFYPPLFISNLISPSSLPGRQPYVLVLVKHSFTCGDCICQVSVPILPCVIHIHHAQLETLWFVGDNQYITRACLQRYLRRETPPAALQELTTPSSIAQGWHRFGPLFRISTFPYTVEFFVHVAIRLPTTRQRRLTIHMSKSKGIQSFCCDKPRF